MDPSIMKLLEEDEDETMHSGAAVEAFTAALNRDIEGDNNSTTQQSSVPDAGALSQGSNHTSSQLFQQWQSSNLEGHSSYPSEDEVKVQTQEQHASARHGSDSDQHQPNEAPQEMSQLPLQPNRPQDDFQQHQAEQHNLHVSQAMSQTMNMQTTERNPGYLQDQNITRNSDGESQYQRMQRMGNQRALATGQPANTVNRPPGKQVPFALLLPVIEPQLDKDRAMQLQTLYHRLKKNNITKEEFVRHLRSLVGDHMLKMAVYKLQQGQAAANSENATNQTPNSAQNSAQHNIQKPSSYVPSSSVQHSSDSSTMAMDTDAQKSRFVEHQSDSQGIQTSQISSSNLSAIRQEREHPFPLQGLGKQQQQQQHMHFPQSFPTYGNTGGNYHPYSSTNMNMLAPSLKQQTHDLQMRQGPVHPSMGVSQVGTTSQVMNQMSLPERQNSFTDVKRMHGGTLGHFSSNSALQQNSGHWQPPIHKDQSHMSSMANVKPEPMDQISEQQKSQLSAPKGTSSFSPGQLDQGSAIPGPAREESFDIQSSRPSFSTSTSMALSNSEPLSITPPMSITAQLERERQNALSSRIQTANSSVGPGSNAKTPPKKPSIGLKKPSDVLGSSLPPPSKKQKVSGESIDQLNDVTAVSGVNLREEEEQLFSGPKEDSRVSEASRKVVQEEEERLILQKVPLQKKLAEIMAKCGVKNRSSDVERCLSLCVEERMRGLISNLIRLSKQRADIEKPRHRTVVTSDVRQQIMAMNQQAREEWEKKQAETEKLQRVDEPEGTIGTDGDDGRGKASKVHKEEDDKMRTTAANVAARAAVGGDDVLSKWQLMAEQARQKREGGADGASTSQPSTDVGPKPVATPGRNSKDHPDMEKRSPGPVIATPGSIRKSGKNQDSSNSGVQRSISIKDVISVLEREEQMSRSTLIYRLYEKVRSDSVSE